jgi:hypothetical protein
MAITKITGGGITADAIDGTKIADDAINSEHLAADSIDAEHYAAGSVDVTALGADAVTAAKIGDDIINSEHYADGSIDNAHIADNAIDSEHYADGSIDNAHIADDAIDSEHYAAGSIDTAHIADDAVDADKLANAINTSIAANTAKTTNATHTGDVTGATALTIAVDAVDIAMLSATGTASSSTFLRGDNAWEAAGVSTLAALTDSTISAADPLPTSNPSAVGHYWVNSTSGKTYICTDAANNSNVWTNSGDGTKKITDGSTSAKAITNIATYESAYRPSKSAGDTSYLYVTDGDTTVQAHFVWLTVDSVLTAYMLVGGMNSDDFSGSKTATSGTYPSSLPFSSSNANSDTLVAANFHLPLTFSVNMGKTGSGYLAGFDKNGKLGTTYIGSDTWWDSLADQLESISQTGVDLDSSGNFKYGTWSMSANISLADSGDKTNARSAGVNVGYWDLHHYYSNPGAHANSYGIKMNDTGGSSGAGDGFVFVR